MGSWSNTPYPSPLNEKDKQANKTKQNKTKQNKHDSFAPPPKKKVSLYLTT